MPCALALLACVSRVYLGAHNPLAGAAGAGAGLLLGGAHPPGQLTPAPQRDSPVCSRTYATTRAVVDVPGSWWVEV